MFGFETTPAPTVGSQVVGADFLATPRSLNQTLTLASGVSAYFAVGNNGAFSFDAVGLSLIVTSAAPTQTSGNVAEPFTFLLTSCGAALAFFLRRRRA